MNYERYFKLNNALQKKKIIDVSKIRKYLGFNMENILVAGNIT